MSEHGFRTFFLQTFLKKSKSTQQHLAKNNFHESKTEKNSPRGMCISPKYPDHSKTDNSHLYMKPTAMQHNFFKNCF